MLFPNSILTGTMSVVLPCLCAAATCVIETFPVIFPSSSSLSVVIVIDSACFCPSIIFFFIAAACILNTATSPTAVAASSLSGLLSIGKSIVNIDIIIIASMFFATAPSGFF